MQAIDRRPAQSLPQLCSARTVSHGVPHREMLTPLTSRTSEFCQERLLPLSAPGVYLDVALMAAEIIIAGDLLQGGAVIAAAVQRQHSVI